MGRGKLAEPAEPTAGAQPGAADPSALLLCGICGEDVDRDEPDGYLRVDCNKCTGFHLHFECAVDYLCARAKEKTNSIASQKYTVKARKNPIHLFEMRMACPNGIYALAADGHRKAGSRSHRGKHALTGACSGITLGGEHIKPAKEAPAPPPQLAPPARTPKEAKKKERPPAKAPPPKRPASSASSASTASHLSAKPARGAGAGPPAPGASAATRLMGASGAAARKPAAAAPPADRLGLPPGSRPLELTLCRNWLDYGGCHEYRCTCCHSEEEQSQRERAWVARQEARKRDAGRAAAVQQAAAASRLEEEQEALAQIASMESLYAPAPRAAAAPAARPSARPAPPPGGAPRLTERSLALLRNAKRSFCLGFLMEMGFSAAQAGAASDAAGADVARAAALLMDGGRCSGVILIDVSTEAEELAAAAATLGYDARAVEAQLELAGGSWEGAVAAMQAPGGSALPEDLASLAPSEPDTPSLHRAPAWAADASSTLSAPSPYATSPRAASLAPAHDMPAAPGVYSLADFSDSPGLDGMLGPAAATASQEAAPAWNAGLFAHGDGTPSGGAAGFDVGAAAAQPPRPAGPATAARVGSPLPAPLPLLVGGRSSAEPAAESFDDGFAAGLAAALRLQQEQMAKQWSQQGASAAQPWAQPAPAAAAASAAALPAAAPLPSQPAARDDEVEELMAMLGIA